jgi:DNA-binding CsgD family transcriptional regulator
MERLRLSDLGVLEAGYPMYAVGLDQRVTRWGDLADSQILPRSEAVGHYCHEVMRRVNPQNAAHCQPNCRVIALARSEIASRDYSILGARVGSQAPRMNVSILLVRGADGETEVLHLVRCIGAVDSEWSPPPPDEAAAPASGVGRATEEPDVTLTPRQVEVLTRLASGETPQQMASDLRVRQVTVRNHVQAAMDRLGARTRLEAVLMAIGHGLIVVGDGGLDTTPYRQVR